MPATICLLQGEYETVPSPRILGTAALTLLISAIPVLAFQIAKEASPEVQVISQFGGLGIVFAMWRFDATRTEKRLIAASKASEERLVDHWKSSEDRMAALIQEQHHTNRQVAQALTTVVTMIERDRR